MSSKTKPTSPAAGLKRVSVRKLRSFRLLYVAYPQIRESVTPELLARLGTGAFQPQLRSQTKPKRETLSPEGFITQLSKEVGA